MALSLVGLILGSCFALLRAPEYQATTKVYVSTNAANSVTDFSQGNSAVQQIVKSYAEVATTPFVLNPVIKELHLNTTTSVLGQHITVDAPTETVVLEITVADPSARRAANIANAVSSNLSAAVGKLSDTSGTTAVVKVTQIEAATAPTAPSSPNLIASLGIGLLLGAAFGLATAMLRDRLDTKVRTVRDVELVADYPVLGRISYSPDAPARPLIDVESGQSARAEEYRSLRTNLQFVNFDRKARVIVVTSSIASEGKSSTVANLGIALASAGRRVLLIDGDLRRPQLADRFGIEGEIGLTDLLIGQVEVTDAVQQSRPNLFILTSGPIPPNPSELLQSRPMSELLQQVGEEYDVVLIDTPPLLPVTDGALLARMAGGAIVVCGANRVRRHQLESAVRALEKVDATVLGMVPTMVHRRPREVDGYGYGYGYSATGAPA